MIEGVVLLDELEVEDGELLEFTENDGVLGFKQNILILQKMIYRLI
jgi:hypothetical protein